jgi:hypothetical protein
MPKHIVIVLFLIVICGCTSKPVYNLENERIPTLANGEQPSSSQVEQAIYSAAQKRGWSPRIVSPGLIEARITVRSHKAAVDIQYSRDSYSITYRDSTNLDYRKGKIHRNYNNWVVKLSGSIQREFGVRTQVY